MVKRRNWGRNWVVGCAKRGLGSGSSVCDRTGHWIAPGLIITEKGNGGGQKSQSELSENANDFTFLLEETGFIEKNTSIEERGKWILKHKVSKVRSFTP